MVSIAASVFFVVCYLLLAGGAYFYKKSEEKFYGITWLSLIFLMIQCYHAFLAAILNVIHIPVNLVTFGIFDLVAAAFFWYFIYKRKIRTRMRRFHICKGQKAYDTLCSTITDYKRL